jgi:hypothetical protein
MKLAGLAVALVSPSVPRQRGAWRPQQLRRLALQGPGEGLEPLNRYASAAMLVGLDRRDADANRLGDSALGKTASSADFEKPTAEIRVWHSPLSPKIFSDGRRQ